MSEDPASDVRVDLYLGPEQIKSGDAAAHYRAANGLVREALAGNPDVGTQIGLTAEQVAHLLQDPLPSDPPPGLAWHHHQDVGRMQLVDAEAYAAFGDDFVSGFRLWGGGR